MHMLCVIISIMEMYYTGFMSFNNIRRQQKPFCKITADFTGHIITLYTVDSRILVGIFLLDFLVGTLDKAEYLIVCGVGFSYKRTGITVSYISSCQLKCTLCHKLIFHHILYFFHSYSSAKLVAFVFNIIGHISDLFITYTSLFTCYICFFYGVDYFVGIKNFLCPVSLYYLQFTSSSEI